MAKQSGVFARNLRKRLSQDPLVTFEFWVRDWGDGKVSVSPDYGTKQRAEILFSVLSNLGYAPQMNGLKGTVGEFVITIHHQ